MKEYAEQFYKGTAWKECAIAYKKSVGGLCEPCREKGIITAGEIVHHKMRITPENICDPNVTLNWNNLQCVCRECHAEAHTKVRRRYKVDKFGRVEAKRDPPR